MLNGIVIPSYVQMFADLVPSDGECGAFYELWGREREKEFKLGQKMYADPTSNYLMLKIVSALFLN